MPFLIRPPNCGVAIVVEIVGVRAKILVLGFKTSNQCPAIAGPVVAAYKKI